MLCLTIKFNCNFYVRHFGTPGRNANVSVSTRLLITEDLRIKKEEFVIVSI